MKIKTKNGATLAEIVSAAPLAAILIVSVSSLIILVVISFKNVTVQFSGNMDAIAARDILEQKIPTVSFLSFDNTAAEGDAIVVQNDKFFYVKNYLKANEVKTEIENVSEMLFDIDMAGKRCRLNYTIKINMKNNDNIIKGSVILLNISDAAFESQNEASLPTTKVLSNNGDFLFFSTGEQ